MCLPIQVAAAKQAQQEKGTLGRGEGVFLGRLLERKPDLEQELLTFRDRLLAHSLILRMMSSSR